MAAYGLRTSCNPPRSKLTRMERTEQRIAFIAIPAMALLAASCGGGQAPDAVTLGGELTFDTPPERIVSLSPGHTEILFEIGAGDQVIAVDNQSDFPPETETKTKLDATSPDDAVLEELQPDLVVVMAGPEEVVQALDQQGFQVLWLELPDSIGSLFDQIDLLGEITGRVEQSDRLVDEMDRRILAVFDEVGATSGPRVYHELDDGLTTASFDTLIGELYLILNSTPIANDPEQPFPQLTLDAIIEADAEAIVVAHSGVTPESVKARPGWQDIPAVKNDRVYAVDPDIVNRPGPRLVDGLETLARLFHPNLFPEP